MKIVDLREKCQSLHKGDFSAQLVRRVSIFLTWMLIPTRISANGVSVLNCLVAVLAGVFFLIGDYWFFWCGIFAFVLNTVLDGVDGEIARYYAKSSLTGLFADRINTLFIYPAICYGLGYGLSLHYNIEILRELGFIAGWSLLGLRFLKTSVDATIVDAFTLTKAKQEASTKDVNSKEFRPLSEELRDTGNWLMILVDFFLVRQPGMCFLWVILGSAELLVRSIFNDVAFYYSPGIWLLCGYSFVGSLSVVYGLAKILRGRVVERQFLSVSRGISEGNEK